jgi:hypothetical protein
MFIQVVNHSSHFEFSKKKKEENNF